MGAFGLELATSKPPGNVQDTRLCYLFFLAGSGNLLPWRRLILHTVGQIQKALHGLLSVQPSSEDFAQETMSGFDPILYVGISVYG